MKKTLVVILLLQFVAGITFAQVAAWRSKVAPEILTGLDKGEPADVLVVFRDQADISGAKKLKTKSEKAHFVYDRLVETASRSQVNAVRILRGQNANVNGLYLVNALAVGKIDLTLTKQLAELQEVKWIGADPWVKFPGPVESSVATPSSERGTVEWGVAKIGAPEVWALGFTGQGITVGGADTGYDWMHPAIQPHYRGWTGDLVTTNHNYNWHDAIHDFSPLNLDSLGNPVGSNPCGFNVTQPCDDGAHGTHTMGTMTGDDGLGNQIGVAPGAKWVGCRNMERGWGQPSTYLECFQWFLAPTDLNGQNANPDKAPHVINNSWYCADIEGCTDLNISDLLRVAIVNLKASGVFVVVSNGNEGWQGCGSTSGPPAYFEESFSVGATRIDDTIAAFSSLGPVLVDSSFRFKPNAVAPGQNIRSSIPNGNYANFSGTSMAGPHMVGLVALVLSARPDLIGQVELIEDIVEGTGIPEFAQSDCSDNGGLSYPNNTYGYGRADALAAVNAALAYNPVSVPEIPSPTAKVFPNPVADEAIFDLQSAAGMAITLNIFSTDGKLVFTKNW
ncbi:MAG TPA: S8 family serine peptidase, partial [Saprospiraceae bacterium]|nr:S8 family serine peptidase [Saprospiraceae bacterium]